MVLTVLIAQMKTGLEMSDIDQRRMIKTEDGCHMHEKL